MVLFREVLIEKNGGVTRLADLNLINLQRVMANGEWNAIGLTNDRTLYFEKDIPPGRKIRLSVIIDPAQENMVFMI
jgi:hypothetical protein